MPPRFELTSDEGVLLLAGAVNGVHALNLLANTRQAHDMFYVKQVPAWGRRFVLGLGPTA